MMSAITSEPDLPNQVAAAGQKPARSIIPRGQPQNINFVLRKAGDRLDAATLAIRQLSDDPAEVDEEKFGNVEREYLEAKATFMAELSVATGLSAAEIERRVCA